MIEYDTVAIKRIDITSDFTLSNYDRNIISSSELVFVNNLFSKYLKKVFTPIKKSLKMTLPKGYTPDVFDDIEKGFSFVFTQSRYSHLVESYTVPDDFEKYLKMIKEMDSQMTELMEPVNLSQRTMLTNIFTMSSLKSYIRENI